MIIGNTSKRKCDARCWNAKSKTCSCACGGAAHGSQPSLQLPLMTGEIVLQVQIEHDDFYEIIEDKRLTIA